ncbi:hypothetical protein LCGC14_2224810, partial [marine sediment metagenome]
NPLRTGLLVAALAVSMGLTLIMITVNEAFGERLDEIKAEVGSGITVRPAGSFGGGFIGRAPIGLNSGGGASEGNTLGDTLADEDIDEIWSIEHVAIVSRTLNVPYAGEGLESAIERPAGFTPRGAGAPEGAGVRSLPVLVTGTDDPNSLTTLGVQDAEIIAGRTFNDDEVEANVAVIGETLAAKNSMEVGDTFEMNDATFEVAGIFTSGTQFGDNSIFLPLSMAQHLFDREDEIDQAVVKADSVDNVDVVAEAIRETLGEDTVDVSTELSIFGAISASLSDARDSSRVGMVAAVVASAAVILFSVGLVARQRIKEIGIFKAIGASNWHVTAQFAIETVVVSVAAALIGALATFPLAQTVADGLVSDPAAPTGPGGFAGPGAQLRGAAEQLQGAGGFLGDVDVAVSPQVFLYALGIAIGLAVIASVVPAWYVGRVKPAEVLRYE